MDNYIIIVVKYEFGSDKEPKLAWLPTQCTREYLDKIKQKLIAEWGNNFQMTHISAKFVNNWTVHKSQVAKEFIKQLS